MDSQNKKVLESFVDYCEKNPNQRFWQALRNWSDYSYIVVTDTEAVLEFDFIKDTFYFNGRCS